MSEKRKVVVMAGTPVDTQMGVEYLEKKCAGSDSALLQPLYRPVAEDCDAQVRFQYMDDDDKRAVMDNLFDIEIEAGARDFFIYCNSLSASFDFDTYAAFKSLETDKDIRIYTPLQIYRKLGRQYGRIGVMAANNLSAHAIEEALMTTNPDIYVIGTGNMSIVRAIEDGFTPAEIAEKCGLRAMTQYMESCDAQALLLGCTHFPYLAEELGKLTSLPLIDPSDEMFTALTAQE